MRRGRPPAVTGPDLLEELCASPATVLELAELFHCGHQPIRNAMRPLVHYGLAVAQPTGRTCRELAYVRAA